MPTAKLQRASRMRSWLIAALAVGLLGGGVWFAVQGALLPDFGKTNVIAGKVIGVVSIVMASLPYVASLWLGAAGWGLPIRRFFAPNARHGVVLQLSAGLGAMLMIDWLAALAGWLNPWTAWAICAGGFFILMSRLPDAARKLMSDPERWPSPPWTLLLGLPAVGLLLTACCCPPGTMWAVEAKGYDVLSYHLQVPREWLEQGAMTSLKHNVYSHLPLLTEAGYMQIGAMVDSVPASVYIVQLFHASTAFLAAAAVACIVGRFVGRAAGIVAGVFLHATPWVIVTASLAYNEMFVMAFASAALLLVFDPASDSRRGAVLTGFLLGVATLAKLTAGPMLAVPIILIVALQLNRSRHWDARLSRRKATVVAATMTAMMVLTICPYLMRNAAWTGNPVFPFAASTLGQGHWDDALVERWNAGHQSESVGEGVSDLGRQWIFNGGFGTAFGGGGKLDNGEAAQFETSGGIPIVLLGGVLGAVLSSIWPPGRHVAAAMGVMLAVQLFFWIGFTHHQSRFLIPTLLPLCVLAGIAVGRSRDLLLRRTAYWTPVAVVIAVVLLLTVSSFKTFFTQTSKIGEHPETKAAIYDPTWRAIDSMEQLTDKMIAEWVPAIAGDHIINHLNHPKRRVLILGDVGKLLYLHGRTGEQFTYNTAFDHSELGTLIRHHRGDLQAVTVALVKQGYTHVWVGWSELNRLYHSYGADPDVIKHILALTKQWRNLHDFTYESIPFASLYKLPSIQSGF